MTKIRIKSLLYPLGSGVNGFVIVQFCVAVLVVQRVAL
ncbi:hypothetical protein SDC9_207098 [bioreactor metagenome]|uniref:Uncharacterized protein n=1 Tax=bioreactor metagenome TaxID=1076179 RepID=A0A645J7K8_9ZZZZ